MPLTFSKNQGAGAPEVEDGLNNFKFLDIELREHPDWATESDKFGKADTGERYHFLFQLLDEDGDEVYDVDSGEPIIVQAVTRLATGEKSNFYAIFTGMMTKTEKAAFDTGEDFDGSVMANRRVYGIVEHNAKGWPEVKSTTPFNKPAKGSKAKAAEEEE